MVRNKPEVALQATIIMGVTRIKENFLVPNDFLKEGSVGGRRNAGAMSDKASEIEPVTGKPLRTCIKPATVAFDVD